MGGESYQTWWLAARSIPPSGHSWCRSAPVAPCDEFCPFSAPDATVLEVEGGSPRPHLPRPGDQAQGCVKGQPSTAGLSSPLPSARPGPTPRPAGSPGGERAAAGSPSAHLPRERQGATGTVGRWNSKGR